MEKTMKKNILFIILLTVFSLPSWAALELKAKCSSGGEAKMKKCFIKEGSNSFDIAYRQKRNAELDRSIAGKKIIRVTQEEINKQRTTEAILISPLFLLSDKKLFNFGIEFYNNGKKEQANVLIKQKYAQQFRTLINSITGKDIEESVAQKVILENKKAKKN